VLSATINRRDNNGASSSSVRRSGTLITRRRQSVSHTAVALRVPPIEHRHLSDELTSTETGDRGTVVPRRQFLPADSGQPRNILELLERVVAHVRRPPRRRGDASCAGLPWNPDLETAANS